MSKTELPTSDALFCALNVLVDLKEHKEIYGKTDRYLRTQPAAWRQAKTLVEQYKQNR